MTTHNDEFEILEVIEREQVLTKAFRYILNNSTSNGLPYHNLNHLLVVANYCNEGYSVENKGGGSRYERVTLLLAALFHDVNHSGGELDDNENIANSIEAFKDFAFKNDLNVSRSKSVVDIIKATEYPYVIPSDDLTPLQGIIRDADLLQVLKYNWVHQNIFGLADELKLDFVEFIPLQKKFIENATFNTNWGKAMKHFYWGQVMESFRTLERIFR